MRPKVTVVCGPPASGKTTYVRKWAQAGDLIVDVDTLYEALSGLPMYDRPKELLSFVCEARDAVIQRLKRHSDVGRAWIITSAPRMATRNSFRLAFAATVIVLEVALNECTRRIDQDERRRGQLGEWHLLVKEWWQNYEPNAADIVTKEDSS
ncbi:MAG: AAA family ATPase [Pseudomonadota bacterium]